MSKTVRSILFVVVFSLLIAACSASAPTSETPAPNLSPVAPTAASTPTPITPEIQNYFICSYEEGKLCESFAYQNGVGELVAIRPVDLGVGDTSLFKKDFIEKDGVIVLTSVDDTDVEIITMFEKSTGEVIYQFHLGEFKTHVDKLTNCKVTDEYVFVEFIDKNGLTVSMSKFFNTSTP